MHLDHYRLVFGTDSRSSRKLSHETKQANIIIIIVIIISIIIINIINRYFCFI